MLFICFQILVRYLKKIWIINWKLNSLQEEVEKFMNLLSKDKFKKKKKFLQKLRIFHLMMHNKEELSKKVQKCIPAH